MDLDRLKLINYDKRTLYINSTELGRITSHYYIACETMVIIIIKICKKNLIIFLKGNIQQKFLFKYGTR
jgi:hypothetical protein